MEKTSTIANERNLFPQLVAAGIVGGAFGATTGWLATRIFTHLNLHPTVGAIFGAAELIASAVVAMPLLNFFGNSEVEKVAKFILNFLGSIAIAYATVLLSGYTITFEASILLGLLIIPTSYITGIFLKTIIACIK